MKKVILTFLIAFFALTTNAYANNIKYVYSGRIGKTFAYHNLVHTIYTAPGYLTTIILPSKALKVFLGNTSNFRASAYGKDIVIKPITYKTGAETDLVILTKKLKFSYRIISGTPKMADFIIFVKSPWSGTYVKNAFDRKLKIKEMKLQKIYQDKFERLAKLNKKIKNDKRFVLGLMLKINKVKINQSQTALNGKFKVKINFISRADGYDYISYKIINNSAELFLFLNENARHNGHILPIYKSNLINKTFKPLTIKTGLIIFKAKKAQPVNLILMFSENKIIKKFSFNSLGEGGNNSNDDN
jgi:hypothetical protein